MRASLVAGVLLLVGAGSAQEPAPSAAFPFHAVRMYPKTNLDVWNETIVMLRDLGIRIEESNRPGQFLVTRWVDIEQRRFGFGPDAMPDRPRSARVQLHVLVSPYLQPARVFVGSMADLNGIRTANGELTGVSRRFFNVARVGEWFLEQLSQRLGTPGIAVPEDAAARQAAARSIWSTAANDPCLLSQPITGAGRGIPGSGRGLGQGDRPEIFPTALREERPLFPAAQMLPGTRNIVVVEALVTEDGFVRPLQFIQRANQDSQFDDAAMGAVSLWRMRPAYRNGCPQAQTMRISTSFNVR